MEEKTPKQKVVDILNDYYGEERVDSQEDDIILIYFPKVTVTNENDRSIDITELYVKIEVDSSGILSGCFTLNRAEYTVEQWEDNYMHSHVHSIPKDNLTEFKTSCLGSGPIRCTCASLNCTFDEDIWKLFAFELDKYIHTESISGVPYHYLEKVGASTGIRFNSCPTLIHSSLWAFPCEFLHHNPVIRAFIPYLIEKRPFSFSYNSKYYHIADSKYNIVIKMSNLFIEWYNRLPISVQRTFNKDSMLESGALIVCKINNENIYERSTHQCTISQCRRVKGTSLWRFKDKRVTLNITGLNFQDSEADENTSILLNPKIVIYIANKIIRTVNYLYGSEERIRANQAAIRL